jgi:hypothetical protein
MNPHELNILHILHVSGVLVLFGATFYGFAGAPETRKRVLMWSGIAALVVFVTGFRLWQGAYDFHGGWVWVKLVCWLGLSSIGGLAYRRRDSVPLLIFLALLFAVTAIAMVYVRPF